MGGHTEECNTHGVRSRRQRALGGEGLVSCWVGGDAFFTSLSYPTTFTLIITIIIIIVLHSSQLHTTLLIHSLTHPLIHSSTHPFIHSSIHPLIHSSTHPFIHSSIHPLIHSSTHPFTHSNEHSPIHSLVNPLIPPFTHPPIYLCLQAKLTFDSPGSAC